MRKVSERGRDVVAEKNKWWLKKRDGEAFNIAKEK